MPQKSSCIKAYLYISLLILYPSLCFAGRIDSLYSKAESCFEVGAYAEMLEYNLQALELAEHAGCKERSYANLKVAHAYYYLQQRQTAIQYLKKAGELAHQCKDSLRIIVLRQLGSVYLETGQTDSAKHYLYTAERLLLTSRNWKELSAVYAILGELNFRHWDRNYFDLAEQYAIKANDTVALAFASVKKGNRAAENGDCREALAYVKRGQELYRQKNLLEGEVYALAILIKVQSQCESADETFKAFYRYDKLKDSIFKKETANKAARYRTLYETEKKERENAELIKNRKLLNAGFMITLLVIGLTFLYFHSRYKIKKQKEIDDQLVAQKQKQFEAVMQAEENERKRIACDLHDGVGQTLSAAKINLSMLQREIPFTNSDQVNAFEKAVALVDESCREVRSVSHNMAPNTLLRSGLSTAIRNFISQIDHRVLNVDFYSEGLHESLETNKEVILYRVIQECVNNVIKHAAATRLTISLIKDEDGISVTIEDNGKGFDVTNIKKAAGIGLENVQSRIAYLNGTVELDSAPNKGTVVAIHVPF